MAHDPKQLVRRAVDEIWNRGNYALLSEFVTDDIVIHASGEDILGPDGIRQFYGALRQAFPNLHFTIEDQLAEGDHVATRWVATGTHEGEFQGIPPTGQSIRLTGIDIDRLVNGKVVECWPEANELGLLQQLGVVPMGEPVAR
jgi:steroid delta-isomerase-like uncharacterized protein